MFGPNLNLNLKIRYYEVQSPINLFFAKEDKVFRGSKNQEEPANLKRGDEIVRLDNLFYLKTDGLIHRLLNVSSELIDSNEAIFEEMANPNAESHYVYIPENNMGFTPGKKHFNDILNLMRDSFDDKKTMEFLIDMLEK